MTPESGTWASRHLPLSCAASFQSGGQRQQGQGCMLRAAGRTRMRRFIIGLVGAACSLASLMAQGDPQPTCKMCPATYMPNDEIQAYVKKAIAERLTDQQVRDVEIGKSHVGIGVV